MGKIFNFDGREKMEQAVKKTWNDFRDCLSEGAFTYDEVNKAKETTFLKTYDDLFNQHSGIKHETLTLGELMTSTMGRGAILAETEAPDYERFIPKKEFITKDNRFSPSGVEWLYLALGEERNIHKCAEAECRAKSGQRFGFCHFTPNVNFENCILIDLTIADDLTYKELEHWLENYGQDQLKEAIKKAKRTGRVLRVNQKEFKEKFTQWAAYTYTKLLSEQIFKPLDATDDKTSIYAPFQTMAQYYISLGYSGIIYGSTVCPVGKNIVLFNKQMAQPTGKIEISVLQ